MTRRQKFFTAAVLLVCSLLATGLMLYFFASPAKGPADSLQKFNFIRLNPIPAKDVELLAVDGQKQKILGLPPGWKLVNLWASWCIPCVEELPSLDAFAFNLKAVSPIQVLAVNYGESTAAVQEFLKAHPTKLGVWRDPNLQTDAWLKSLARPDLPPGLPQTYLIDQRGNLVALLLGKANWADQGLQDIFTHLP